MIPHIGPKENPENELCLSFIAAIKNLSISSILTKCNIRKDYRTISGESTGEKRSAYEIFLFLLLMVFQCCNLYRYLGSKKQDIACSKSTYHRFLSNEHFNWRKFITLLSAKVAIAFHKLTSRDRFCALVIDDSVIGRKRSKTVELLASVFDHVIGKSVRGFNLLVIGWTDGFSFLPVAFNMLSSVKKENRFKDANSGIDKRTNGYKAREAAVQKKPDAAISMIRDALASGVPAEYILMDTWFTNEPFIKRVLDEGLHVIGMLKDNKQMYHLGKRLYGLKSLSSYFAKMHKPNDILGSVIVRTRREQIPVKLVFVRNRNKRSEYIVILSTDCTLSDEEIIRRYGYRWSIECCFKVCKSLLKLGKEFQPVNYDTTVSSTALVLTRYIILEWIRRRNSDAHSLGEIFFYCYDDVKDIELTDALESLIYIMTQGLAEGTIWIADPVRKELIDWYVSQPAFIRSICKSLAEGSLITDGAGVKAISMEQISDNSPEHKAA